MHNKTLYVNPSIPLITLNINDLNKKLKDIVRLDKITRPKYSYI